MTIQRYIRLTNLIPKVLDMVDEGKIAFTIAVELSYLTEEQQYELYEVMDIEQCTPSLSQANRMKRMSQSESLDMDAMFSILEQEKAAGENVPYCCNMEVKLRGSNNVFSLQSS